MTQPQPLKAALWMLGAVASFTLMTVAARATASELDTFETMMYRSVIGLALVSATATVLGRWDLIRFRRLGTHLTRNISHFTGQNLWFYAITVAPLAQVISIEFSTPIWIALAAPFILGERLTGIRAISILAGFCGVLIVARPDFSNVDPGLVAAALAAIGFAGSALFTKKLVATETTASVMFFLTLMQMVFGIVCAGIDGDVALPSAGIWPWLLVIGVTGLTAHFSVTTALTHAPVTIVMPFDFLRLPVVAIVGALVYSEALDIWVFVGACVIFGANYFNMWAERRAARARARARHLA